MSFVRRSTFAGPATSAGVFGRRRSRRLGISAASIGRSTASRDTRLAAVSLRRSRAARRRGGGRATSRRLPRASATAPRRARRRRRSSRSPRFARSRLSDSSTSGPRLFSTTTCVSANAATCARCVTHSTWCRAPSVASRRPTAMPASPPIPASTSSNTSVGGASVSTTRAASIARESSPPDAARASGRGLSPGLGASRNVTRSAPSSVGSPGSISTSMRRVRHRQLPEVLLHRPGERRRGRVPGRRQRGRRLEHGALELAALRLELRRARVVALDLSEAGRGPDPRTRRRRRASRRTSGRGRAGAGDGDGRLRAAAGRR